MLYYHCFELIHFLLKGSTVLAPKKKYSSQKKRHDYIAHDFQQMPRKKKSLGQHFLRKQSVVDHMIESVTLNPEGHILEIGCGDGFLTRALIATKSSGVRCYEIDQEWADIVRQEINNPKLDLRLENVLEADWSTLAEQKQWVILANLPYQITFPILYKIIEHRHFFSEGVVMIQEEVAQKIVSKGGRGYGVTPLKMQYYFEELKLLEKVEPGAFTPPPSVFSRLLYFKPRKILQEIPHEYLFWKFLGHCFQSPRQNLKNNIRGTVYPTSLFTEEELKLRAQQMSWNDLMALWKRIIDAGYCS